MGYKSFRINSIARVALLCATFSLLFLLIIHTNYYTTIFLVGILIVYQTYGLIRYVEKTNQNLIHFLQAIRHEDFSQSFSGKGLGSSFKQLSSAYNEVLEAFRRARAEKEEHYRYLQTVVQHVGVGLICFQPTGEVELINTAAQRLLKTGQIRNIRELQPLSNELVETLFQLKAGGKALVKAGKNSEKLYLAIYATELRMRSQPYTLVSVQNIQSELEEKEMEAWQNLVRVLTHEIMNSITPISSLASTANDLLKSTVRKSEKFPGEEFKPEYFKDIQEAVQTIHKRSEGLLHFVDSYRKITRIPKPRFRILPVAELFSRVRHLMSAELDAKGIELKAAITPETLELTADPELVEQVLINLLMNAIQALEGHAEGSIGLVARMDSSGRTLIEVTDNGPGILEEVQEKIFIPFFTTRQDGTGIGLSISRQIMRLHKGSISVQSKPDIETIFTLRF